MRHSILTVFFFCSLLSFNNVYSVGLVNINNIAGIYQNRDGSSDYLTINRKDNNFIIVNITKEMSLLNKLELIDADEINTLTPPIEEFAFSFFILESDTGYMFPLDLVIPFPNRTTRTTSLQYPIIINFSLDDTNNFVLGFYTDGGILFYLNVSYKKIF
jgi:hypothetical protein